MFPSHIDVSLSPSLPLSLKSINVFFKKCFNEMCEVTNLRSVLARLTSHALKCRNYSNDTAKNIQQEKLKRRICHVVSAGRAKNGHSSCWTVAYAQNIGAFRSFSVAECLPSMELKRMMKVKVKHCLSQGWQLQPGAVFGLLLILVNKILLEQR